MVPLSERLYYVQALLFPEWTSGDLDAPVKLYATYTYERGGDLSRGPVAIGRATQEVVVEVRLVAEVEGRFHLVEEKQQVGGSGSRNYWELVLGAVGRLEVLREKGEEVEKVLEAIAGYATGLDWDTSLELPRRLALLQWALTSQYWADREQAAGALGEIGPEAKETIHVLIQALGDEDWSVRHAIAEALGKISRGTEEAVPALIQALGDNKWERRQAAAWALGKIGPEEGVISALIKALADGHKNVRWAAADALA